MPPCNLAVVCGVLSKVPEPRVLPDGTTVWELDLRVRPDDRPVSTVPVSWLAPPNGCVQPASWSLGEELVVVGSVRRRFYRAGGTTVSRTDVLAERVVPARQRKRSAGAVADAVAVLGLAGDPLRESAAE